MVSSSAEHFSSFTEDMEPSLSLGEEKSQLSILGTFLEELLNGVGWLNVTARK